MKKILYKQGWHLISLLILLLGMTFVLKIEHILQGEFWGLSTKTWMMIVLAIPILHQIYVVLVWRLEFYQQAISKKFGDAGFKLFGFLFILFLIGRPLTIIFLAISNQESFELLWSWRWILTIILGVPFVYLIYSLMNYFGIPRALGEDHFKPEEYRNSTLIKQGIFKFTNNGMYLYGFLGLYLPGILLASKAALAAAVFQHLYIWVHFYVTEKPDMEAIYGKD